ncbi:hypothetical protein DFJ74DRAFT_9469 [Hyaloraphidium curvatum]|nr:hypothetical protein DFJ74DRAFT_9469 [Hyaloraphidium curvatum]
MATLTPLDTAADARTISPQSPRRFRPGLGTLRGAQTAALRRAPAAAIPLSPAAALRLGAAAIGFVALFALVPNAAAYGLTLREVIDPATGFLVCRSVDQGRYNNFQASQCIGWCDGGPASYYSSRRLSRRSSPWGFTCGRYNGTGSCVRAPSLGCAWIRASALTGKKAYDPELHYRARCEGPVNGTCSLFSDPFCTHPTNGDPVLGGGANCSAVSTNGTISWNESYSWCGEVYSYILKPAKPEGCLDVTETSSNVTFFGPWMTVRSCEDNGNYLRIRRAGHRVVCHGPDSSHCSWYTDLALSVLAPGEPKPSFEYLFKEDGGRLTSGATCDQTDSGWCKLAADAALRGNPPNYECPGLAAPVTPTRTSTTTTATTTPFPPPTPLSDWHCVGVKCSPYMKVRLVDFNEPFYGKKMDSIQCAGPDGDRCFAYADAGCTTEVPWPDSCVAGQGPCLGETAVGPAPSAAAGGHVCYTVEFLDFWDDGCVCPCRDSWCVRIGLAFRPEWRYENASLLTQTTAPPGPYPTPQLADWTCMRSCSDKGNYVAVRGAGRVAQCRGPDPDRCSWFSDRDCTLLAPGEPAPSIVSNGMMCPERAGGWCARAVRVLSGEQAPDLDCSTSSEAVVATATSAAAVSTIAPGRPSGAKALRSAALFALPALVIGLLLAMMYVA